MRNNGFRTYALMISVILWGVLLGGVAYSHIVFFPVYLSDLPASAVIVNGPYALNEARFWMLLHPLLILSLLISLIANWRIRSRRPLIASTAGIYLIIIVITSLYFLPELIRFHDSPTSGIPAAEWLARGNSWQYLSWLRGATLFIAAVPLLIALTRPESTHADS
jgi:hypothetical protein